MDERLSMIGSEGLNESKYRELNKETGKLALLLEDALSKDKKGLVNDYDDLMAGRKGKCRIFYTLRDL